MEKNNMWSKTTIKELKQILRKEYGRNVSLEKASEVAYALVSYFDLLAEIYQKEKTKNYNNHEPNNKQN